jgi:hypothetical protein
MSKTRLQSAKERAPGIPPNTCPYIDSIIEILDDFELTQYGVDSRRKEIIVTTLEYVRESNCTLRESSKFWHDEFVKVVKRI